MRKTIELEFSKTDDNEIPTILSVNSTDHPSLRDMMETMTDEFIEEKGNISCEFSTCPERIADVMRLARELNKKLFDMGASWMFFCCDVCGGHDKENFIHCEIREV